MGEASALLPTGEGHELVRRARVDPVTPVAGVGPAAHILLDKRDAWTTRAKRGVLASPRVRRALPGRDGEDINQLCADLIEFCNAQAPIPVELRNPILIKKILDDWEIQKKNKAE